MMAMMGKPNVGRLAILRYSAQPQLCGASKFGLKSFHVIASVYYYQLRYVAPIFCVYSPKVYTKNQL